jgi:hypothetical protein
MPKHWCNAKTLLKGQNINAMPKHDCNVKTLLQCQNITAMSKHYCNVKTLLQRQNITAMLTHYCNAKTLQQDQHKCVFPNFNLKFIFKRNSFFTFLLFCRHSDTKTTLVRFYDFTTLKIPRNVVVLGDTLTFKNN